MNPKYYLWIKEDSEGCDYMVGCGEKLVSLDATTIDLAKLEAMKKLDDLGLFDSEHTARHVILYNFVENMTHIYEAEDKKRSSVTAEEVKKRKIEELEAELKKLKGAGT